MTRSPLKLASWATLAVIIAGFIAYVSWVLITTGTVDPADAIGFAIWHMAIDATVIFLVVYVVGRKMG